MSGRSLARLGAGAFGASVFVLASAAEAGNGPEPRTPVDWAGAPCMTIVDRSMSSTVHLDYAIPMEDTELTDDEVEDSRRHQFFGFCRALDPQTYLPRWISQADVERAREIGIAPETVNESNVMESNAEWADCWHRINADDERRPITFAAADEGVDWDTAELAAGTYVVEAYTWEPPLNIWSSRTGVIKVVDDPDPAVSGPAVGINNTQEVIDQTETAMIEGCASAQEGSFLTAYWGLPAGEVTWEPFVDNHPVRGDSFALEFDPPQEIAGESVMIRVDITDPSGRRYTHYMRDLVFVLGDPYPPQCEGSVFIDPDCVDEAGSSGGAETGEGDSTSSATESSSSGSTGDDGMSAGGAGGEGGRGCRVPGPDAPAGPGLLLVALAALRRRR
ncbi:MAG: MYXO-CTERM sorting domain-containing protein [Nannocystales bacterium]